MPRPAAAARGPSRRSDLVLDGGIAVTLDAPGIVPGSEIVIAGETIAEAQVYNDDVIRPLDRPISTAAGVAILRGNLAPDGAVMKPAAAEARLHKHSGPALVFRDYNEMAANIDREDLEVTREHVLVLQNAGPNRARKISMDCSAAARCANHANTVEPLPDISAPMAPSSLNASTYRRSTGYFQNAGASREL